VDNGFYQFLVVSIIIILGMFSYDTNNELIRTKEDFKNYKIEVHTRLKNNPEAIKVLKQIDKEENEYWDYIMTNFN
jgi:hypothetical protein